jgi:hypothetical protein
MNEDAVVTFPECDKNQFYSPEADKPLEYPAPWSVTKTASPHFISINSEALSRFNQGDFIAAFNTTGMCVGYAIVNDAKNNLALIVNGNDPTTNDVDGMLEDEPIMLKLYRPSTDEMYDIDVIWDTKMPDHSGLFKTYGLSGITVALPSGLESQDTNHNQPQVLLFPNPAKDEVVIAIDGIILKNGLIHVFRIDGSLVISVNIESNRQAIDISMLKPGVYIVSIELHNRKLINKRLIKN